MPRLAALLLSALAALVTTATPAPEPKPWVTGWDKPVDELGNCTFRREGERLAISIPKDDLDPSMGYSFHLLRAVEGDFVADVRVSGDFQADARSEDEPCLHAAGLLLLGPQCQEAGIIWSVFDDSQKGSDVRAYVLAGGEYHSQKCKEESPPSQEPIRLRLERRGSRMAGWYSKDGIRWTRVKSFPAKLSQKVKVGVVAQVVGSGFQPEFDHFKLSRPSN
jgi:hypothetical protein